MKIDDDHLYHGAALIQIAEHPHFTAINSLKSGGHIVRVAYKINNDIAVYFKYSSKAKGQYKEFIFTFTDEHIEEIAAIAIANTKCFIALICVSEREIACLSYEQLNKLFKARRNALAALGRKEAAITVVVTAPVRKNMRVYVNQPGKKGVPLGTTKVSRKAYPEDIFV